MSPIFGAKSRSTAECRGRSSRFDYMVRYLPVISAPGTFSLWCLACNFESLDFVADGLNCVLSRLRNFVQGTVRVSPALILFKLEENPGLISPPLTSILTSVQSKLSLLTTTNCVLSNVTEAFSPTALVGIWVGVGVT